MLSEEMWGAVSVHVKGVEVWAPTFLSHVFMELTLCT